MFVPWCAPIISCVCRDDVSILLSKAGSSLTVKVLLDTLQQTTEFEHSIAKKWATSVSTILFLFLLASDIYIPHHTYIGGRNFEEHIDHTFKACKENISRL